MQNKIFELNERLAADSILIKNLNLCELRLMKDGELDWFILVPRRADIIEVTDLEEEDVTLLWNEIQVVTRALKAYAKLDKVNIGMIGNIVSQLHIHIIGRKKDDRAWPNVIWGTKASLDFDESKLTFWKSKFKA